MFNAVYRSGWNIASYSAGDYDDIKVPITKSTLLKDSDAGFHALNSKRAAIRNSKCVIAKVALAGNVAVHKGHGYRAQYMKILEVHYRESITFEKRNPYRKVNINNVKDDADDYNKCLAIVDLQQ